MKKLIQIISVTLCLMTPTLHAKEFSKEDACNIFQAVAEHFVLEQQHGAKQQDLIQSVENYKKFPQDAKESLTHMLNFIYTTFEIEPEEDRKQQLATIFGQRAHDQCIEKIIE